MYIRKQKNQEIYNIHFPTGEIHSSHPTRRIAKQQLKQQLKGGFISPTTIYNAYQTYNTYTQGREKGLPPYSRETLKKYGSHKVVSAILFRIPIPSAISYGIKYIVDNKEILKQFYESLFHLGIILTLDNGILINVDKDQVIHINKINKIPMQSTITGTELQEINLNHNILSLDQVIENTRKLMGDKKFELYDPIHSNCQDLILSLLKANEYGSKQDEVFIKQDLTQLVKNIKYYPYFKTFIDKIIDVARLSDIIVFGKGRRSIK